MILRWSFGILALIVVPSTCLAQGGGMGGMGGGMGGMGGGMGGGFGGMGGRMGPPGRIATQSLERKAVFELEGGRTLSGTVEISQVIVNTELGQYVIRPDQVKSIRYLKPDDAANPGEQKQSGKVITHTGDEVSGTVSTGDWILDLGFGTLQLDGSKVRTVTFSAPAGQEKDAAPKTGGTSNRGLKVTPIQGPNIAALMIEGPKITRIAASDGIAGDWVPHELKAPLEGRATPVVGGGVAVYTIGSTVYAFSGKVKRWDVLELPSGVPVFPTVGSGTVLVGLGDRIHQFTAESGKWKYVDLGAIVQGSRPAERPLQETPVKP